MDKELVELHDLYNKHDPIWVATLIGPVGMQGRNLIVAVGACPCGMGVFTSMTAYKPTEQEPLGEWMWEKAPLSTTLQVDGAWKEPFEKLMSHNPELLEAHKVYLESRKQKDAVKGECR